MLLEASEPDLNLVADIGGTNTRVALTRRAHTVPHDIKRYHNADHAGLSDVLKQYIHDVGANPAHIIGVCAAAAGTVQNGVATLTNLDWRIDRREIEQALSARKIAVLNDLQAQGHALNQIAAAHLINIVPHPPAPAHATKLVVGIGTGFNACAVFDTKIGTFVPPSEAGHIALPASDATIAPIVADMIARFGFASVEEVLSGRGIAYIHDILHKTPLTTPEVMARLRADDPAAKDTARVFARIMGAVVGDLALIHLPLGGIYLVGGVANAFAPYLATLGFVEALRAKGRFSSVMSQFGVQIVTDDYAALIGCAAHLAKL